jgi:4-amino-4-deoxy-L-arabinose transferase-like glycosyltransferase
VIRPCRARRGEVGRASSAEARLSSADRQLPIAAQALSTRRRSSRAVIGWGLVVFLVGVLGRLFFVFWSVDGSGDSLHYTLIARNLIHHHIYAIDPASPTIFRPPGYPCFIAAIYLLFGEQNTAVMVAQSVLGALSDILLYLLLRQLTPEGVARFTSLMTAAYPHLDVYASNILTETLLSALLVLMVYALYGERSSGSWYLPLVSGGAAALAALFSPRFLVAPLIAAACSWLAHRDRATRLRSAALSLATAAGLLLPWTVRNYLVFRVFAPSAWATPNLSIWLAARRVGVYGYWTPQEYSVPLHRRYLEVFSDHAHERERMKERSSIGQELGREARRLIAADPVGYLGDRIRKYPRFWIQPAAYAGYFRPPFTMQNKGLETMLARRAYLPAAARMLSIVIFTLAPAMLVILGFFLLLPCWREHAPPYMLVLWVAVSLAPLAVEHRFTVVIHPILAIFGAAGLEALLAWPWRQRRRGPGRGDAGAAGNRHGNIALR